MSCWGLWQNATSFFFVSIYILFCGPHSASPIFSLWETVYGMHVSVFALFMRLCAES